MYDKLKALGIPVTLTRDSDITLTPTERVNRILDAYGNREDVIVVSNHINAGGGDGAEVIYALRNDDTLANLILKNLEEAGQNVRKVYQRRLPSDSSKDYYFIHRLTGNTQPVIVEYGFLDSTGDDVNQLKNQYEKLANAVVRALIEYIGVEIEENDKTYYTVVSGDSLWSIAKKYGITVDELKNANNLTSNLLRIGQQLLIPTETQTPSNDNIYIVQSGDTLYSIARKLGLSVSELMEYNNLKSNILSIGQILKIPTTTSVNYEYYTVQKGDTLYGIAQKYNTSVDDIIKLNNLSTTVLSINQMLKIPVQSNTDYLEYIVMPGDTLYSIANKYNISVNELKTYNNLNTDLLSIGQVLKIPTSEEENKTYIVQKGDTLYSIASKYNTTVSELKSKNGLTSDILTIGQLLDI
jgi:LysM repeat protein